MKHIFFVTGCLDCILFDSCRLKCRFYRREVTKIKNQYAIKREIHKPEWCKVKGVIVEEEV